MKRRSEEPVPLRDAIEQVGRELGLAGPDVVDTLTAHWREIVGPAIAGVVIARFRRLQLQVRVGKGEERGEQNGVARSLRSF